MARDRSPLVTLLVVIALFAIALVVGGLARQVALVLGDGPRIAGSIGAMTAMAAFVVLVLAYYLQAFVPGTADVEEDRRP